MDDMNKPCELSLDELDAVSGGDMLSKIGETLIHIAHAVADAISSVDAGSGSGSASGSGSGSASGVAPKSTWL